MKRPEKPIHRHFDAGGPIEEPELPPGLRWAERYDYSETKSGHHWYYLNDKDSVERFWVCRDPLGGYWCGPMAPDPGEDDWDEHDVAGLIVRVVAKKRLGI